MQSSVKNADVKNDYVLHEAWEIETFIGFQYIRPFLKFEILTVIQPDLMYGSSLLLCFSNTIDTKMHKQDH